MTRFAIAALATLGIVLATGAHAQITFCSTTLSGATVNNNLSVPDGTTCFLSGVAVVGNVLVGTNATLRASSGTKISGNIQAVSCNSVELTTPIFVGGNLEIDNCTGSGFLEPPGSNSGPVGTIRGNVSCENNGGDCVMRSFEVGGNISFINNVISQVTNTTVGGNLSVSNNTSTNPSTPQEVGEDTVKGNVEVNNNSSPAIVGNNVIGGNLQCMNNSQGVTDDNVGPNTVNGKKLGQCSGL